MKKTTSKKLRNYGALSAAIMATAAVSGQNVFTDIDDVTLDAVTGGNIDIDLNQDGLIDYNLQISVVAGGTSFTITPDAANNAGGAFVGIAAAGFQYPFLLSADDVIDTSSGFTDPGARGDLNFYGCAYTNSQFCGDIVDGYIGLLFDFNGNNHYGWILLDSSVPPSPNGNTGTVTIRSYAFNATPEATVIVGDETLSLEDNAIEGLNSYVANDALTITARSPLENVTIHNLNGQVVVSQKLNNTTETVNLSALSTGMYIATVQTEGKVQAIKFVK